MNNMKGISLMVLVVSFLMMSFVYASQKERIAVAADKKMPDAAVSSQAGRSSFFLLFDDKGTFLEAIVNPYTDVKSRGIAVADFLAAKGITAVVAGSFGDRITEGLKNKGIRALTFKGKAADAVKKVLSK
jgi:predicted Fe-Mo cluster-binding NifX family protein